MIVSADDFGGSEQVNSAVVKAHRKGVLTCAGLMVKGEAARQAVELARACPNLAIGLHLVLSDGSSTLPREAVPDLVDEHSRFARSPARAAVRYYFDPRARRQLKREIQAQFDAFAETGLKLDHVDGHQHLHAHPAVLPAVIEQACRYGAAGIRIPRDPLVANLRVDTSALRCKAIVALGHAYLAWVCQRLLPDSGLAVCNATIGSLMSGQMSAGYVMRMLERLDQRSVEVFFHPSEADSGERFGPCSGDMRALLDPALRSFIGQHGYRLGHYADLHREGSAHELGK